MKRKTEMFKSEADKKRKFVGKKTVRSVRACVCVGAGGWVWRNYAANVLVHAWKMVPNGWFWHRINVRTTHTTAHSICQYLGLTMDSHILASRYVRACNFLYGCLGWIFFWFAVAHTCGNAYMPATHTHNFETFWPFLFAFGNSCHALSNKFGSFMDFVFFHFISLRFRILFVFGLVFDYYFACLLDMGWMFVFAVFVEHVCVNVSKVVLFPRHSRALEGSYTLW